MENNIMEYCYIFSADVLWITDFDTSYVKFVYFAQKQQSRLPIYIYYCNLCVVKTLLIVYFAISTTSNYIFPQWFNN